MRCECRAGNCLCMPSHRRGPDERLAPATRVASIDGEALFDAASQSVSLDFGATRPPEKRRPVEAPFLSGEVVRLSLSATTCPGFTHTRRDPGSSRALTTN